MAKTIEEFRDELRALREEMFENSENADLKLVASYVDRLVMSLEGLTETLEAMETEVECSCECCSTMGSPAKKPAGKAKKPAKRKRK